MSSFFSHKYLFSGYPQPEFQWLKDGEPLGSFSPNSYYRISEATRGDAGDYRCLATNSAGTILSAKNSVLVACEFILS